MQKTLVAPVGVLGFGVEGQSTFNYLVRNGVKDIVVMDKNPVTLPEVPAGVNVKVFSGEGYLDGLKDCVTVVRSAGVYPMSQDLFKFQMNGGIMTSQIQLFLEQTKSKKVVGVTGTLGKGSTVSMISHILTKCGVENEIGGNFGVPALDLLETETPDRISILELSSFQLMTLSLSPDVGVVLRVSTEHLDWHKSVEEYRDAKANLVRWQKRAGTCVYLKDAEPTAKIAGESPAGTKYAVSLKDGPSAGDGDAVIDGATLAIDGEKLYLADCKVRGIYQLENMAAATLAVKALGNQGGRRLRSPQELRDAPLPHGIQGRKERHRILQRQLRHPPRRDDRRDCQHEAPLRAHSRRLREERRLHRTFEHSRKGTPEPEAYRAHRRHRRTYARRLEKGRRRCGRHQDGLVPHTRRSFCR